MCIRKASLMLRFVSSWVAVALLSGGIGGVQAADGGGREISLQTVYLTEPVGQTHRISIEGRAPGNAQVTLDPNVCGINLFGDRTVCTLIATRTVDVKVVQIRLADESSQGRAIYELQGSLTQADSRWFLVGPPRGGSHYRLVVQTGKDNRRPITLEPRRSPKPQMCRKVKYRAEQAAGVVTIYAKGSNPTAGYEVRFEQLPIEIFPPQFRLLCIEPTGIVAQVITPFEVQTSFRAEDPIKAVIVHDADGKHEVPVKQASRKRKK